MLNIEGEFIGYILVGENIIQWVILEKDVFICIWVMNEVIVSIVIFDVIQFGNLFIYVNSVFEKFMGYWKVEVIGKNC